MAKRRKKTGRRNRRSGFQQYKKSIMIISMILILLTCVLSVNAVSLHAKSKSYAKQETELQAQIAAQKSRADEVKQFQEYVQTDEYIKEVAEEKLGLVDPNEIIFKPAQ